MRFLDTHTGQFIERGPRMTDYAILSHTWREKEQLLDELKVVQARYSGSSHTGYSTPSLKGAGGWWSRYRPAVSLRARRKCVRSRSIAGETQT